MPVAVKVLHESFQSDIDFCRRFYAEALAASRLDHPNITRVIDFGQEPDGQLYFAMEFLDGSRAPERARPGAKLLDPGASRAHDDAGLRRSLARACARDRPSRHQAGEPRPRPEARTTMATPTESGEGLRLRHRASIVRCQPRKKASSPARPSTCRPSSAVRMSSMHGATSTRAASSSTSSRPARCRSLRSARTQLLNKHQFTPPLTPSKDRPGRRSAARRRSS